MTNKADPYVLADEVVIWASALLDVAVLNEALTSRDSAERLQNMDAGEVIRRAFGKLKNIRAQHNRIVGELRADRDSWAEQAEQRLADWDEMRKERDAALARVAEMETMADNYCELLMDANAKLAELEKQEPINLQHMAVAADGELRWMTGRKIDNCELYAMPDFGQAPKLYAAPVAQAQHSVPEGYRLIRLEHFAAIKAQLNPEQVDAYLGRNVYDEEKVYANWDKCRSALDEIKEVFQQIDWDTENELAELLAAAPRQGGRS